MSESSACLFRSFSQPSPTSQESAEGDPLRHALTSSISFGRFVSESLAWEKWSSFSQNRYLEEAEKYSKPGSVAEKKAYFEAHYKKIAAKKAASLLEQQSTPVNNVSMVNMTRGTDTNSRIDMEPAQECEHIKIEEMRGETAFLEQQNASVNNVSVVNMTGGNDDNSPTDMEPAQECEHIKIEEMRGETALLEQQSASVNNVTVVNIYCGKDDNSPIDMEPAQECEHIKIEEMQGETALLEQQSASINNVIVVNMTSGNDDDNSLMDMEPAQECEHIQIEEMQGESTVNTDIVCPVDAKQQSFPKERTIACTKSEGVEQAIEHPVVSENHVDSSNQQQVSIIIHENQEVKTRSKDAFAIGDSASSGKRETAFSSGKSPKHNQEPKISVKPKVPIYPRKGDHAINPFSKKTASQPLEKKGPTSKSLHMSINFTSRADDTNGTSPPVPQKIVDSRLYKNVARTMKESSNQHTLTRASVGGISKHLSVIPQVEKGRTKTILDHSITQSSSRDRKSKSPSMHISKSKNTCGSKAQSPTESSSFSLRSEERAATRKEFFEKLEQKRSIKEAEKEQCQSKQKVKAKDDSKDGCRSVSSKAKANAEFHLGTKSPSVAMKKISTLPCLPKIERKQASEVHINDSRPPWRLSMKTDSFRDVIGNKLQPPAYSAKLVPKKNTHENTSPNIQL